MRVRSALPCGSRGTGGGLAPAWLCRRQLISSLLAVSCVTVAFCSNLTMVFDKVSGARNDLTVSPVRPAVLSLSYYLATFCTTLLINGIAAAACFGYLALTAGI